MAISVPKSSRLRRLIRPWRTPLTSHCIHRHFCTLRGTSPYSVGHTAPASAVYAREASNPNDYWTWRSMIVVYGGRSMLMHAKEQRYIQAFSWTRPAWHLTHREVFPIADFPLSFSSVFLRAVGRPNGRNGRPDGELPLGSLL